MSEKKIECSKNGVKEFEMIPSRIYSVSDLHVSYPENKLYLKNYFAKNESHKNDILIIAGDVSHSICEIDEIFELFSKSFKIVFYAFGNHDLWLIPSSKDTKEYGKIETSDDKMDEIIKVCKKHNVQYEALKINDRVWIIPLFTWYDSDFNGKEISYKEYSQVLAADYRYCKWKNGKNSWKHKGGLSEWFLAKNKIPSDIKKDDFVITVSHFLPRVDLLPSQSCLTYPGIVKMVGSIHNDIFLRKLNSSIHVTGHTHINFDTVKKGVRYVQNALGYPGEKRPFLKDREIFDVPIVTMENDKKGKIKIKMKKIKYPELSSFNTYKYFVAGYLKMAKYFRKK